MNNMLHSTSLKNPMQFYPTHTYTSSHTTNLKWIEDEHSKISSDNIPPHRITFSPPPPLTFWINHSIAYCVNSTFNRRIDVFSIPLQIGDGAFVDAVESILETEFYEDEDKLSCWEYLTRRFVEAQETGERLEWEMLLCPLIRSLFLKLGDAIC